MIYLRHREGYCSSGYIYIRPNNELCTLGGTEAFDILTSLYSEPLMFAWVDSLFEFHQQARNFQRVLPVPPTETRNNWLEKAVIHKTTNVLSMEFEGVGDIKLGIENPPNSLVTTWKGVIE